MGTGNSQDITITSSTNLSDEDIEKAVKEAEQFAAEDKKKKEAVDTRNMADNIVYQTEKTLADLGDKISEDEKNGIQAEVDKLKEMLKAEEIDVEAVKAQTEAVSKKFYDVSSKLYADAAQAQGAAEGAAGAENQSAAEDNVVDADYKVVDDEQ